MKRVQTLAIVLTTFHTTSISVKSSSDFFLSDHKPTLTQNYLPKYSMCYLSGTCYCFGWQTWFTLPKKKTELNVLYYSQ